MKTVTELTENYSEQFAKFGLSPSEFNLLLHAFLKEDPEPILIDLLERAPLLRLVGRAMLNTFSLVYSYAWIAFSGNAAAINTR